MLARLTKSWRCARSRGASAPTVVTSVSDALASRRAVVVQSVEFTPRSRSFVAPGGDPERRRPSISRGTFTFFFFCHPSFPSCSCDEMRSAWIFSIRVFSKTPATKVFSLLKVNSTLSFYIATCSGFFSIHFRARRWDAFFEYSLRSFENQYWMILVTAINKP